MKKRITMIMLSMTILAGCTATPALAYTDNETDQRGTVVIGVDTETAETEEGNASEIESAEVTESGEAADGAVAEQSAEGEEPVIDRSEPTEALTPEGNMTLVDDSSAGTKQFLTLTTRDGNFYYLIIDRDKDGNENVHFLNQVDERDLISLMDDGEAKEVKEEFARQAEEKEAEPAALAAPPAEPEPTTEAQAPKQESFIEIGGLRISQKTLPLGVTALVLFVVAIALLVRSRKQKSAENSKPDPDAEYEGDGIVLEQEEEEKISK